MPTDPSGTPSGFFDFLDPSQEVPFLDEAGVDSPNFDFIMGFEADLDSSFEVLRKEDTLEKVGESEPTPPVVEVKTSIPLVPSVSKRAPSMPTIFEESEEEEEEGDVTITPNPAQKALLPPDRFARPRSTSPQNAGAAAVPEDLGEDSLDTPRPQGELLLRLPRVVASVTDPSDDTFTAQASTFSVPAPDPFDASFSLEACPKDSQEDSLCQSDFFSSLIAGNQPAAFDFNGSFDVDISAWDEAVFGESPSQESTSSSSSSSWDLTSKEEPRMGVGAGIGTDMQFQFPSVNAGAIGDRDGLPTEDEFLKAVVSTVQSTPKRVS